MARILIVEDEQMIRDAYEKLLTKAGHEVLTAGSGAAGVGTANIQKPDLILLDLLMPESNGLEFLKQFNTHTNPDTRIIVFTNMGTLPIEMEAKSLGITEYVIKSSLSPQQLLDKVENALR